MTHTEDPRHYVFVYGTLKRGGGLSCCLTGDHCTYIGDDQVAGRLYDTGVGYPAMVEPLSEKDIVSGEVYAVTTDVLERLDIVEGCPSLYRRVTLTTLNTSMSVEGYLYQQPTATMQPITSGIWS